MICAHNIVRMQHGAVGDRLVMRLEFRAVEGGFEGDKDGLSYCLICGVSGQDTAGEEHYLNFQRGFEDEDPSEDWGVHCEFDDQINGAYNCVRRCRLTRTSLEVDLGRAIDWQKKYMGLVVDISALEETVIEAMRAGLPRIFRGTEGILELG
jgi:hypothetical protein